MKCLPKKIGIIGTGHLAGFLVEGMVKSGADCEFTLSPRGAQTAASLTEKFGAKIGGASESDQKVLYNYALKIGMGFQMMDDYLDCFGNAEFGKKIGGDILEDKKTWLYIKALELASPGQKAVMASWKGETTLQDEKIAAIRSIFVDLHVEKLIQAQIRNHFVSADKELAQLETSGAEHELKEYVQWLSNRVV